MTTRLPGAIDAPDISSDAPLRVVENSTTSISSAYDGLPTSSRHRVTGFISMEDFNFLFRDTCPVQGMQNKVVSGLIFPFVRALRAEQLSNPTANPYQLAINLINRTNFHVQTP